ncbi:MAG: radical SAM protein [Polyangiaceae bacterium]
MRTAQLRHVVWELTLACDLGCKHCGSRAGKPRGEELTTEEALDVVAQLADLGAKEVSLIGGEAYLRDDWHVIARAIHDAGMIASMVSGGRGFSPERARQAKEAGIDTVSISIDGIGATHDLQRGLAGSFDAAVASMRNLRDAGVVVSANSQLNRVSFPDMDALLDLILEHGARGWQIAITVPMGRAAERPEWLFQPDDLLVVTPKLAELCVRAKEGGCLLYGANNVGYFGPHEDTLRGHILPELEGAHWDGCGAGSSVMGIESDGAIKGCPSLPTASYTGGHVRRRTLREIWDTAPELAFTRGDRTSELWGYCKECYYAEDCLAGCSWAAHVFFGRRGNNPYCHHRALEMDKKGLRERLVRVEAAPGLPFDHGRFDIVVEPAPKIEGERKVPVVTVPEKKRLPITRE